MKPKADEESDKRIEISLRRIINKLLKSDQVSLKVLSDASLSDL